MRQWSFVTQTESDTVRVAEALAQGAVAGSVLTLEGDLGVGKTRFVQAFARSLGINQAVRSPTFVLIQEYAEGRIPLVHMDLYRVTQAADMGLEEYWHCGAICVIEWASRIVALLPLERLDVCLRYVPEQGAAVRRWEVVASGAAYETWFASTVCVALEL